MKRLDFYIGKVLLSTILVIGLILMSIEMLVMFIAELGNIGVGNYSILQALRYVILDMPFQLNDLFPMAGLIGSLVALGVLASQSELIVMQTSGYSPYQILAAIIKSAVLVVILTFIVGEIFAPYAEQRAIQGRAMAKSAKEAVLTAQGIWLLQNHQFIYIRNVENTHMLLGITDYVFDNQLKMTAKIEAVSAINTSAGWMLHDVKENLIFPDHILFKQAKILPWNVTLDPKLLVANENTLREMSLLHLWHYMYYLQQNGLDDTNYAFAFWKRVFQPLSTLIMIFLGVPFIFGPLRTVTMGLRIISGIAVGFSFYILNQIMPSIITLYQWPPIIGVIVPIFLFTLLGFVLLNRVRG